MENYQYLYEVMEQQHIEIYVVLPPHMIRH